MRLPVYRATTSRRCASGAKRCPLRRQDGQRQLVEEVAQQRIADVLPSGHRGDPLANQDRAQHQGHAAAPCSITDERAVDGDIADAYEVGRGGHLIRHLGERRLGWAQRIAAAFDERPLVGFGGVSLRQFDQPSTDLVRFGKVAFEQVTAARL